MSNSSDNGEGSGELRRRRVKDNLIGLLRARPDVFLIKGAIGIGKSFVCKDAIKACAANRDESWVGIFLGWEELSLRRRAEVLTEGTGGFEWVDVSRFAGGTPLEDEEVAEPINTENLLGPPRHMRRELVDLCQRSNVRLALIMDKYESLGRFELHPEDYEALLEVVAAGAVLLVEVRDPHFRALPSRQGEYELLAGRTQVPIPSPTLEETNRMVRSFLYTEGLLGRPRSDRLVQDVSNTVVRCCGNHPGTVETFFRAVKTVADARRLEHLSDGDLRLLEEAGRQSTVTKYLKSRWNSLGTEERELLAAVAVSQESRRELKAIRQIWTLATGRDRDEVQDEEIIEQLHVEQGLVRRGGTGVVVVSGEFMKRIILEENEAVALRALARRGRSSLHEFDWRWLLFFWVFSTVLYLSLNVLSLVSDRPIPEELWVVSWAPIILYFAVLLIGWVRKGLFSVRA